MDTHTPGGLDGGLLTIAEAASWLRISRSHIYKLLQYGAIRSVRIGRARRVPKADLVAFAVEHLDEGEVRR